MTTERKSRANPVRTSARDPVAGWLDVFIPMTGLPRARAEEIRAELEDHLRARVDDLMITGLTEAEAVRRAVAELGETAELARQFRVALKPNRRILMQTALIAVGGIAVYFGVSTLVPSPPPAPPAVQVVVEGEEFGAPAGLDFKIDLSEGTYGAAFASLGERADRPVLVRWEDIEDVGISPTSLHGLGLESLAFARFLGIVSERTPIDPVVAHVEPDLIEITVQSRIDRRTMQIRTYDITGLVEFHSGRSIDEIAFTGGVDTGHENGQLMSARHQWRDARREWNEAADQILKRIMVFSSRDIWSDFGGDRANAEFSGSSLMIEGPERVHEQVERVIGKMREDAEQSRRLAREAAGRRDAEQKNLRDRRQAEQKEQALSLQAEMEELLDHIVRLEEAKAHLQARLIRVPDQVYTRMQEESDDRALTYNPGVQARVAEAEAPLRTEIIRITITLDDFRVFRDSVRQRLIALEYGQEGSSDGTAGAPHKQLINPDDYRRSDGTVDYEALRAAVRQRAVDGQRE